MTFSVFQQDHDGNDVGVIATFNTYEAAWEKLTQVTLANDGDVAIYIIRET